MVMTDRETAEKSLILSIAANPRELRTYCALAKVYQASGQARKAEFTLRRAIEIDPLYHRAWVDLGILYSNLENWRGSVDAFERACALDPQDPASWIGYGWALIATQDIRAATKVRDTLLAKFPDQCEGHLLAGHIYKICGHAGAAAQAYRHALQVNPRQTDAMYNLADLSPPLLSDPLARNLEELRTDPSLSPRESANVCFALARIYEESGHIEEAMTRYHEANAAAEGAMRELGIAYDPLQMEQETTQKIEMFGPSAFSTALEPLDLDMTILFIVGLPRSGTTLVERILSSHSLVKAGGELPFMQDCLSQLLASRRSRGRQGSLNLEDDDERRILLQLRDEYLDSLFERDLDGEYVTDKLPANFSALGLIRILFPDAPIIHCSRDPIANCWSLYSAHFGIHLPYHANLEHLVHYYNNVYTRWMRHWNRVIGSSVIDVSYDKLVMDPEPEMHLLIRRCGLAWEDNCLRFYENDQPIFTANMQQARQPISSASANRWRKFDKHLAPLKRGLATAGQEHWLGQET